MFEIEFTGRSRGYINTTLYEGTDPDPRDIVIQRLQYAKDNGYTVYYTYYGHYDSYEGKTHVYVGVKILNNREIEVLPLYAKNFSWVKYGNRHAPVDFMFYKMKPKVYKYKISSDMSLSFKNTIWFKLE